MWGDCIFLKKWGLVHLFAFRTMNVLDNKPAIYQLFPFLICTVLSSYIFEVLTTYFVIFRVHLITVFEKLFPKVFDQFLCEWPFLLCNDEICQLHCQIAKHTFSITV